MFIGIEDSIKSIKNGEVIILVDDEHAESGGVLFVASSIVTKEHINYMMKHGTGFTHITLQEDDEKSTQLPRVKSVDGKSDSYDISIDFKELDNGVTPFHRSITIRKVVEETVDVSNFVTPGHVFIMQSKVGGVLKRAGFQEAATDLASLAGFYPSGVISKILTKDGEIAKGGEIIKLANEEELPIVTIESLIAYRREKDCYVVKEAEANLPTEYGQFNMVGFVNTINGEHHVALVKGEIDEGDEVLVRVHSECLTGDAFHSLKCDCGEQLATALKMIEKEGKGILLYLRQEGRGIGLINKIKAYKLQEQGLDTEEANLYLGFPSDMRDYGIGAQILSELNVRKVRLITNNPKKIVGLNGHGIKIVDRVPIIMDTNEHNKRYFETKKDKMGHLY